MPDVFIKHTGLNIYKAGGLEFLPGNNQIDKAAWEKAKADLPLVRHRVAEGILVEISPAAEPGVAPGSDAGEESNSPLAGNQKAAIAFINDTVDAKLLEALRDEETAGQGRQGVLKAIEKQLAAIDPANKDKGEGDK
jgi:hypothetical protein